jgi:hypothetical protein
MKHCRQLAWFGARWCGLWWWGGGISASVAGQGEGSCVARVWTAVLACKWRAWLGLGCRAVRMRASLRLQFQLQSGRAAARPSHRGLPYARPMPAYGPKRVQGDCGCGGRLLLAQTFH